MIIEFKVSNFRSILKKQTFSLVASTGNELEDNLCTSSCDGSFRLVRAAVIYGANAGGKSNLLSALLFIRKFIISSAKESQQGEQIPLDSFAFDKSSRKEPSEFEITFIKNKIRYQYGFVADAERVFEEWLFAYPSGKPQRWFSRIYDKENKQYSWHFSKFFKGGKQVNELTRSNVLFLSNAVLLNNEQLAPVFEWFQKDLVFIDSPTGQGLSSSPSIELLKTEEGKKRILHFMLAADPSIADIKLDMKKPDEDKIHFPNSIPLEVQNYFKKEILNKDHPIINFTHGGNVSLGIFDESEGTQKLLAYAGHWIDAIDNGRTLIIDELDNSLHPLVVRFLIKLICNPEVNKTNAQLIFSTHDTSLLDNELFRRDQVWFVEKDKENSTQLYPLLDFSPRKHEAIGRGYLQGRYGALPYIGEWRF
jgi:AAA15 family ATPase/GTPase